MTLILNDDKTEFFGIGTPQKVDIKSICVGNSDIHPVPTARNLGSRFDSKLSLSKHITKICASSFFHLYNIQRIRNYLSQTSTETLIHAFVSRRLNYCDSLSYGLPDSLLNKLQSVRNAWTRLIFNEHKFCHTTPLIMELHRLPVRFRIELFLLGVHQDIIMLGTQMIASYLVILVSYPKHHLVIDPALL